MRWVDRGPAPPGVTHYAREYTQLWVRFFRENAGSRPSEHNYWALFAQDLRERFSNKCGYCERKCDRSEGPSGSRSPTVDHFRLLNQFPELAYEWTNWISSCRRCNEDYKGGAWPPSGYVDPCAEEISERPERYFDYNHATGEIIPRVGLPQVARDKARRTAEDLGLNERDLRVGRIRWVERFQDELSQNDVAEWMRIVDGYIDATEEYCGITRMFLAQYQKPGR